MQAHKKWIVIFLLPAVSLFLLIYAIPLGMVFVTSLTNYRLTSLNVDFVGLKNYVRLFTDPDFYIALRNTGVWILIQCVLHVALGVALALVLYKKPFGWKVVRTVYMIPNIISNAAIGMIFINVFNPQFGIINSFLRMIGHDELTKNWLMTQGTAFPSVTFTWILFAGYTTTIVLSHALSIDESLYEAARIDGATNRQVDFYMTLPLLKKIIGTTVVMAATYMLQMFDIIYITTGGGPGKATTNLPLMLYGVYKSENNYAYANTVGVCIIVSGIVVMTLINKLFKVNDPE
jgi:raffinose/stachyose/melibiose transport system permease protein